MSRKPLERVKRNAYQGVNRVYLTKRGAAISWARQALADYCQSQGCYLAKRWNGETKTCFLHTNSYDNTYLMNAATDAVMQGKMDAIPAIIEHYRADVTAEFGGPK